jgi:hypothetical protein
MTVIKPIQPLTSSLQYMWRLSGLAVLAFVAFGLIGCRTPDSDLAEIRSSTASGTGSTQPGSTTSPDSNSETKPEIETPDAAQTSAVKKTIAKIGTPDDAALEIKEDSGPWKDSKPPSTSLADTLGSKIDDGFAQMPATMAEVNLEIVDRGAVLKSLPKIKIQDEKNYSIEYTSTESRGSTNSLTADGKDRVVFENGKVTKMAPLGERETRVKMNRAQIEEFARLMPSEGFSYYSRGDRPWSAFISGLQDPKNNFEVTFSEIEANPVGEKRPFYRMIARSTKGHTMDIELVVDSKRNLPVVFRATSKYEDGQDRRLFWKANWKFGGNFEKGEFKIPMTKK